MADNVQIKRGVKAEIPTLLLGELGYCTDTKEIYIGTSAGNELIGKVSWGTDVTSLQTKVNNLNTTVAGKLTATASNAVSNLAAEATITDVITAFNSLLTNMKSSGLMKNG